MKILCNKCYQPLIVHEYDIGIYVDACECRQEECEESMKYEMDSGVDESYTKGYDNGYEDGYKDAKEESIT
jgi:flagellar biosynthesis/type III secretory pathway protein FliH